MLKKLPLNLYGREVWNMSAFIPIILRPPYYPLAAQRACSALFEDTGQN
jgi:hypothetical protein